LSICIFIKKSKNKSKKGKNKFLTRSFNRKLAARLRREQPISVEKIFYQRMDKIYEWDDRGAFIKTIKGRIIIFNTRCAQATKNTKLRALCAFVFYWVGGYHPLRSSHQEH
jgi:hypothetical protein